MQKRHDIFRTWVDELGFEKAGVKKTLQNEGSAANSLSNAGFQEYRGLWSYPSTLTGAAADAGGAAGLGMPARGVPADNGSS